MSEPQFEIQRSSWIPLFDDVASNYDQIVPFFTALADLFAKWLDPAPGIRVLDLATGRGAIISALMTHDDGSSQYTGIDLSEQMLARTARDFRDRGVANATFLKMNAEQLSFPDASFDLVTCGFALHLFDEPGKAIAEAYRVLAPGGTLAFSTPGGATGRCVEFYDALTREFSKRIPASESNRSRLDLDTISTAGFLDLETTTAEVHLPVASPALFWNGEMSHGRRRFFEQLAPADLDEFRRRLLTFLEQEQAAGGIMFDRGAIFRRARKPGGAGL